MPNKLKIKVREATNQHGHEVLTKETIIKHLENLRNAFWDVRGDMLDYSDEQLRILVEEYITQQQKDFTFKSIIFCQSFLMVSTQLLFR